ncbi:MAG: hypothetical protein IJU91_08725 [Selenomonadaceae bacterium]|nr:hypothetical protein [Selenomonadaceae bacterium]
MKKVTTARVPTEEIESLEGKLTTLNFFAPNTNEYMAACIDTIKNCYARIAQAEDKLWQFQLEKENYERDVTALENEIANLKLIDAIDDIGGSADAVDASVAAMIDLNSANDFTAAETLKPKSQITDEDVRLYNRIKNEFKISYGKNGRASWYHLEDEYVEKKDGPICLAPTGRKIWQRYSKETIEYWFASGMVFNCWWDWNEVDFSAEKFKAMYDAEHNSENAHK